MTPPDRRARRPRDERRGGRRKARELVFRALYESAISGDPPGEILELSLGKSRLTLGARRYALRVVERLAGGLDEADAAIAAHLAHWDPERLGGVERAVLRLACVELRWHAEIDARVILDEAIRLAQRYGNEESGAFVNGVLDALARRLRPGELEEQRNRP